MYNVLEKERAGAELTAGEREIHEQALVSVLAELHAELDAAVADAYGWPADLPDEEILTRLVALNAERAAEERAGRVRWLRPDFQAPGEAAATQARLLEMVPAAVGPVVAAIAPWPKRLPERVSAVRDLLVRGGDWTAEQVAAAFHRARRTDVAQVLESLEALGLAVHFGEGPTLRFRATERRAAASA